MNKIQTTYIPTLSNTLIENELVAAFAPVAFALPVESVRIPFLPLSRMIEDGYHLVGAAREHLDVLAKVGVVATHIDVLEHRIAALKTVHNAWIKERVAGLSTTVVSALEQAEALRHEVLGFARVAVAKNPVMANRLSGLSMGDSPSLIVDDLNLLMGLMVDAKASFSSIQLDVNGYKTKLETTLDIIEKGMKDFVITESMVQLHGLRDRMYTLASDSLFEICDAAWAVFGTDRATKGQWTSYATMAEYGWSL